MDNENTKNDNAAESASEQAASASALDLAIPDSTQEQAQGAATGQAAGETELSPDVLAVIGVNLAADAVTGLYPFLEYDEAVRGEAVSKLTPLLEKYNISSPLLNKWALEIEAGFFFGGLIVAGFFKVREFNKAKNAQHEKEVKTANHDDNYDDGKAHDAGSPLGSTFKFADSGAS